MVQSVYSSFSSRSRLKVLANFATKIERICWHV
uniref:Uncharacterized protein n=1 Tax=Rhizophora mucronata TaxID=61149 RepID=A0A2P2MXZ4_RHIMU